jgi:hypothetical protein
MQDFLQPTRPSDRPFGLVSVRSMPRTVRSTRRGRHCRCRGVGYLRQTRIATAADGSLAETSHPQTLRPHSGMREIMQNTGSASAPAAMTESSRASEQLVAETDSKNAKCRTTQRSLTAPDPSGDSGANTKLDGRYLSGCRDNKKNVYRLRSAHADHNGGGVG